MIAGTSFPIKAFTALHAVVWRYGLSILPALFKVNKHISLRRECACPQVGITWTPVHGACIWWKMYKSFLQAKKYRSEITFMWSCGFCLLLATAVCWPAETVDLQMQKKLDILCTQHSILFNLVFSDLNTKCINTKNCTWSSLK